MDERDYKAMNNKQDDNFVKPTEWFQTKQIKMETIEKQLCYLKAKILKLQDVPDNIRLELANDIYKIEQALNIDDVIERAFYAGREITSTEERGMLFEHVYKEFTDYKKDVL